MDICDELEAKWGTVHSGAFNAMRKAKREIERLRAFEQRVEIAVIPWLTGLNDPALAPTERVALAVEAMKRSAMGDDA